MTQLNLAINLIAQIADDAAAFLAVDHRQALLRHALQAGRLSCQAGRIPKKRYATASSPFDGVISYIPGE